MYTFLRQTGSCDEPGDIESWVPSEQRTGVCSRIHREKVEIKRGSVTSYRSATSLNGVDERRQQKEIGSGFGF